MTLKAKPGSAVPAETARAAFPKGNANLTLRDELETLYSDGLFAALFPTRGQPAASPAYLALVTVLQFAEGLSDRQAAEAVRSRTQSRADCIVIDWKYLLGLELEDPDFDFSVLSEFRARLIAGGQEQDLLDIVLECFRERGLLKERGKQRTDSTHIQAAVRNVNRLECVGETSQPRLDVVRHTLNSLARVAPDWLRAHVPYEWY